MSGFGERFRKAGYDVPKPLIEVDGKPIIQHVVEMFPGEKDIVFICNKDHLQESEYRMRETLEAIVPSGRVISIDPHKLGPVHAVLQAIEHLDPEKPHTDEAGQAIHYGTRYITGKYLEVSNFTNKYHEFKVQRKKIRDILLTV